MEVSQNIAVVDLIVEPHEYFVMFKTFPCIRHAEMLGVSPGVAAVLGISTFHLLSNGARAWVFSRAYPKGVVITVARNGRYDIVYRIRGEGASDD